jgi:hypothetical protein
MRLVAALAFTLGCYRSAPPPPPPAPPVPIAQVASPTASCGKAAFGIEQGTKSIRPPESTVVDDMRETCVEDGWPEAAIDCFSRMTEGDLAKCAVQLPDEARERMFGALGGDLRDRTAVAIAIAKLSTLNVGVVACDNFVSAVGRVLACDKMPIEERAQLGAETADFWSLPTSGLSPDAERRMGDVCGKSLASLQQRAVGVGCMP